MYRTKFSFEPTYPEIDDANFKGTLWTFKQGLALKLGVLYGISIVLLLMSSHKALSGYGAPFQFCLQWIDYWSDWKTNITELSTLNICENSLLDSQLFFLCLGKVKAKVSLPRLVPFADLYVK